MLKDKRGLDMPSKNSILRKMGKKASKPKSRCQGVFFCDNVIKEKETEKLSLIGLFRAITVKAFPTTHPRMHVFFSLIGCKGKTQIELLLKTPDGEEIDKIGGPINIPDESAETDVNFVINQFPIEKAGDYPVEVLINGVVITSRAVRVVPLPKPKRKAKRKPKRKTKRSS